MGPGSGQMSPWPRVPLAAEEQRSRETGLRRVHRGGQWMPKATEHQTRSPPLRVEGRGGGTGGLRRLLKGSHSAPG